MVSDYVITGLLAAAPVSEARGALIYGMAKGLDPVMLFILAVSFNILSVPVIFWLLDRPWFLNLAKKIFGKRIYDKIEKNKGIINKYGVWGLLPFLAIPLPVTGAWTAAFIAVLLEMDKKKALAAISIGVVIAAMIVLGGIYGTISLLS